MSERILRPVWRAQGGLGWITLDLVLAVVSAPAALGACSESGEGNGLADASAGERLGAEDSRVVATGVDIAIDATWSRPRDGAVDRAVGDSAGGDLRRDGLLVVDAAAVDGPLPIDLSLPDGLSLGDGPLLPDMSAAMRCKYWSDLYRGTVELNKYCQPGSGSCNTLIADELQCPCLTFFNPGPTQTMLLVLAKFKHNFVTENCHLSPPTCPPCGPTPTIGVCQPTAPGPGICVDH